jgi:hypothetical protein
VIQFYASAAMQEFIDCVTLPSYHAKDKPYDRGVHAGGGLAALRWRQEHGGHRKQRRHALRHGPSNR